MVNFSDNVTLFDRFGRVADQLWTDFVDNNVKRFSKSSYRRAAEVKLT